MRRPFKDKRPIWSFMQKEPEPTDVEIRNGPIFTKLTVTTFQGSREESPFIDRDHINFVDNEVKRIMTSTEVKERVDFAGELKEFDIFTFESTDLTIDSFIRHPEDMLSIVRLEEIVDVFQANINPHEDLTVRSFDVVSREFVEQKHPDII